MLCEGKCLWREAVNEKKRPLMKELEMESWQWSFLWEQFPSSGLWWIVQKVHARFFIDRPPIPLSFSKGPPQHLYGNYRNHSGRQMQTEGINNHVRRSAEKKAWVFHGQVEFNFFPQFPPNPASNWQVQCCLWRWGEVSFQRRSMQHAVNEHPGARALSTLKKKQIKKTPTFLACNMITTEDILSTMATCVLHWESRRWSKAFCWTRVLHIISEMYWHTLFFDSWLYAH